MPLTVTILPEARLALIEGAGFVTGSDIAEACLTMGRAPNWEGGFDNVWDFSAATQIDITPDELDEIVALTHTYADLVGGNKVVFVSSRDAIAALARLFELRTAALNRAYHVTHTRAAAAEWLGLAPGTLDGV